MEVSTGGANVTRLTDVYQHKHNLWERRKGTCAANWAAGSDEKAPLSIALYGCSVKKKGVLQRIMEAFLAPKGVSEEIRLGNVTSVHLASVALWLNGLALDTEFWHSITFSSDYDCGHNAQNPEMFLLPTPALSTRRARTMDVGSIFAAMQQHAELAAMPFLDFNLFLCCASQL
ncbi:hypothetical protein EDD22DRAFT_846850 [Suillus occidentalis]|nr:hypothetical protein EDD22DRAFT_846850 [Suillus occidentalis]